MFHEVPLQIDESNDISIAISDESFIYFINTLIGLGYEFGDIKDITEVTERKKVYLTFDDIFITAYENALKFLTKERIPFTCFIAPQLLDTSNFIKTSQLMELAQNPYCTIGAHSNTHMKLRDLSDMQILDEFLESKKALEILTKKSIEIMAYPYGSRSACPPRVKRIADEAGFKIAFSTYRIPAVRKYIEKNRCFIPRINVIESNYKKTIQYMEESSNA